MKLKDVIEAVGVRKDWIHFDVDWNLTDNGQITLAVPVSMTLDSDVDVHYQWFWHCNPDVDTAEIVNAIETHDYATFARWFETLELKYPMIYLPSDAEMFVDGKYVGTVCVAFSEQTFNLITSQDHECG